MIYIDLCESCRQLQDWHTILGDALWLCMQWIRNNIKQDKFHTILTSPTSCIPYPCLYNMYDTILLVHVQRTCLGTTASSNIFGTSMARSSISSQKVQLESPRGTSWGYDSHWCLIQGLKPITFTNQKTLHIELYVY